MKISDLEFEQGRLVKIGMMRHQYLDGGAMTKAISDLAAMVHDLQHQLQEVIGTHEEFDEMPCSSLQVLHKIAVARARHKLEAMK